ncbi:MAG: ABC transporter permease [Acidimicrobiales bacterium]|jgi:peptide/nickel transport system permease protein
MRLFLGRVRGAVEVIVTLFLVTIVTFYLTSKLPGNEGAVICGSAPLSCVRHEDAILYLNHPFFARYFHWLGNLLSGNLGNTLTPPVPITTLLKQDYPVTLELVIFSQVMAVIVAIPMAMWGALRADGIFDKVTTSLSFATLSLPTFIVGPLLVLIFTLSKPFNWFPGVASTVPSFGSSPLTNLDVMFLPSLALAIGSLAVYQRLLRADMIATLEEDFIVMARAKGLSTWRILFRHAFRPSTFTVMTVGGVQVATLITGAVIVEYVFGLQGLGSALIAAVSEKDLPTVQVITIIVAVAFIVINFTIDQLYTVIDPRVRRARAV